MGTVPLDQRRRPLMGSLISPAELQALLVGPERDRPTLVDVRWALGAGAEANRATYLSGHLPGAVFLDLETGLSGPVRDALKILQNAGLVTIHPYRGAQVVRIARASRLARSVGEVRSSVSSPTTSMPAVASIVFPWG